MNELAKIKVTSDPADSNSLPGWVYRNPEIYERERNEIFFRSWQYAGWVGDLKAPGDYITANVLDQSVIILRDQDGNLRGFHNVCQHRGHQLLSGCGHVNTISCPYHAWVYRLDGHLRNARGAERLANFNAAQFDLRPIRVELFADMFVFFNLDMNAVPLGELVGDLMADVVAEIPELKTLVRTQSGPVQQDGSVPTMFPCQANWKIVVDNFLECNHCRPSHPGFCDIVDMKTYRTYASGEWSTQKGLTRDGRKVRFWWLFPTTTISVIDDADDFAFSIGPFTTPDGVDRSLAGHVDLYRKPGTDLTRPRGAIFGAMTGIEDRALCESVHRGLASIGYDSGRIIYDAEGCETTEVGIHAFHKLVVDRLGL
ncbi:aromatic ring-hydroxylating oxygenase subunit alpha [Gluconacetobacter tumulisoli]|uniref:Aromatic ring-hydroxylating dioxygenase subunit alpha n=1 Tax=Gluconacetobacter tumulisoli TaxID=1286189 RepID=A0A7W4K471_9PROT|nr:aromatic ring-hydroxylating dioxygenase subunit alpha [Gluconacetobacter tumulisoli]MBB2200074.1 aromatic ring-hydroxylating dioxygenase subunit alpha [Gluconacetobacter tumulisoli]